MGLIAVNWKPDRRQLRWFGLFCVIGFGGIGTWIFFQQRLFGVEFVESTATVTAQVLWGLAGVCGLAALVLPVALGPLYVALTAISLPIGFVLSHVLMALLFYGLLTPVGLFFRMIGRDPLDRKFDRAASTYWIPRESVKDVTRYYRQF
jgi:hypothetical protein